jgi:hypothetical protein
MMVIMIISTSSPYWMDGRWQVLLLLPTPFYRWKNWGMISFKITYLESSSTKTGPRQSDSTAISPLCLISKSSLRESQFLHLVETLSPSLTALEWFPFCYMPSSWKTVSVLGSCMLLLDALCLFHWLGWTWRGGANCGSANFLSILQVDVTSFSFLFFVILGFELRALY